MPGNILGRATALYIKCQKGYLQKPFEILENFCENICLRLQIAIGGRESFDSSDGLPYAFEHPITGEKFLSRQASAAMVLFWNLQPDVFDLATSSNTENKTFGSGRTGAIIPNLNKSRLCTVFNKLDLDKFNKTVW